ncbi:MAG TPA: LysE family transporter, partial [Gammaproteobacteria bacterium]|nr:LysE family transporter [Gammaproteobacteria bacterium]
IMLAFALILPFGPQNIFLFNIGAMYPRYIHALPALITAAVADSALILLAVLGASVLLLEFPMIKTTLIILGVLFLLYVGWSIWISVPVDHNSSNSEGVKTWPVKKQILLAASFSLLNPHAIIDTMAVIGVTAFTYQGSERAVFTLACIIVSWVWFFSLAYMGRKILKARPNFYKIFNRISACLIWASAALLVHQNFLSA